MKKSLFFPLQVSLYTVGYLFTSGSIIQAQVVPDGTTNTTVNAENGNFTIEQGDRAGNNLFHSFGDFSVPTDGSAFFNNAADISNIFSRVTGGNISNIDGLIGANGSANLFLINPAGILFGNNARLNIGGSFLGTTADSILFEDGVFSSTDLDNPPLLTINAPIGLNFRDNPGDIVLNNSIDINTGLVNAEENQIALIGGDIVLEGSSLTLNGGGITLGGLASSGTVGLNEDSSLNFPDNIALSDIQLNNSSLTVNASEGDISINTDTLSLGQNSSLIAQIPEGANIGSTGTGNIEILANNINLDDSFIAVAGFGEGDTGNVLLRAAEEIFLDNNSGIFSAVISDALGNSGDIEIAANSLTLLNGSSIESFSSGQGNSGNISIQTDRDININGVDESGISSAITTSINAEGTGDSGDINLEASSINLSDSGQINTSIFGIGNGGNINIIADELISIDGDSANGFGSGIFSQIFPEGIGNAGDINIATSDLFLTNGSAITASTFGQGNAGSIDINVVNDIDIDGASLDGFSSGVTSNVGLGAEGNAGGVNIATGNLSLTNGGQVNAGVFGIGNGGDITINTFDTISIDGDSANGFGSGIFSQVFSGGLGSAGDINIATSDLFLTNGSTITASTLGLGDAGSIDINVVNDIDIDGASLDGFSSGVTSNVESGAEGDAGGVNIATDNLSLTNGGQINTGTSGLGDAGGVNITTNNLALIDGGQISASTFGEGNAGNIEINNAETITISGFTENNSSGLFANALINDGSGGDVNINTNQLNITNGGIVTASNFDNLGIIEAGTGRSGSIRIQANEIDLRNNASIDAATQNSDGVGGNISLEVANSIALQDNSLISAQVLQSGNGGNIDIETGFLFAFPSELGSDGNDILASAEGGNGGNISIETNLGIIFGLGIRSSTPGNGTNDIDVSGNFSIGSIQPTFKIDIQPSINTIEVEQTIAKACQVNKKVITNNGLAIKGKGGIPNDPSLPLDSQNVSVNGETNSISAIPQPVETSQGEIQPARGIKVTEDGRIVLTAYRTNNSGDRIPHNSQNCS